MKRKSLLSKVEKVQLAKLSRAFHIPNEKIIKKMGLWYLAFLKAAT